MVCFTAQNIWLRSLRTALCLLFIVGCALLEAQEINEVSTTKFELGGRGVSKTNDGLEVKTEAGDTIKVVTSESTDFAMRLANPWFDAQSRQVVVDGKPKANGQRNRIKYALPAGKLYLLAQFRSVKQRDRIMNGATWRINNYLISDQSIDAALPTGKDLLLAGELDLKNLELVIDGKRYPIMLGFRGATLRGRSIADIVPQETVVLIAGNESDNSKVVDTVLFMIR